MNQSKPSGVERYTWKREHNYVQGSEATVYEEIKDWDGFEFRMDKNGYTDDFYRIMDDIDCRWTDLWIHGVCYIIFEKKEDAVLFGLRYGHHII